MKLQVIRLRAETERIKSFEPLARRLVLDL